MSTQSLAAQPRARFPGATASAGKAAADEAAAGTAGGEAAAGTAAVCQAAVSIRSPSVVMKVVGLLYEMLPAVLPELQQAAGARQLMERLLEVRLAKAGRTSGLMAGRRLRKAIYIHASQCIIRMVECRVLFCAQLQTQQRCSACLQGLPPDCVWHSACSASETQQRSCHMPPA